MADRINRAIELLSQGQAIYYDGPHSGHVLTYAQGRDDAGTWADYMNVGMEHGSLRHGGAGRVFARHGRWRPDALRPSHAGGHRRGAGERHRRGKRAVQCLAVPSDPRAWRARHSAVSGGDCRCRAGIHRVLPLSASRGGGGPRHPVAGAAHAWRRASGTRWRQASLASARAAAGPRSTAAAIWGVSQQEYMQRCEPWPLNPGGELLLGVKLESPEGIANCEAICAVPGLGFAEMGPGDLGLSLGYTTLQRDPYPPEMAEARERVFGRVSSQWHCVSGRLLAGATSSRGWTRACG